jgi:NADH-quinone oxidoreductase subunit L
LAANFRGLHQLLMDKWRVDEFYDATILAASRGIAWLCSRFDQYIVDGLLTQVTTQAVQAISFALTRMQTGLVHTYGAVMAVGLLAIVFHFIVPHVDPTIVGEPTGMRVVSLAANPGLAYEYRWDFDGNGVFDTEWSKQSNAEHLFADHELQEFAVVFEGATYASQARTFFVKPNERLEVSSGALSNMVGRGALSTSEFGESWQEPTNAGAPTITADEHGIVIRPHGARVRKDGQLALADSDVHVARGEHVTLGEARLSVSGVARPRVSVRNVFGLEREETVAVVVPKVSPRITAQVAVARGVTP